MRTKLVMGRQQQRLVVAKRMKKGQQQRQQRTMRLDQPTKQSGLRQKVRMR